jgi:Fe-S oxidoreductase
MYLSRGRYITLNNFFNNGKKLSKDFIKNLDICLNCNLCKNFCPSAIDAIKIFTKLKNEYKYKIFPFYLKFFIYLFLKKISLKKIKVRRIKINKQTKKEKILYFQGCINKYVNPSDKNATLNLLNLLGYNDIKIIDNCCGLPFLSDGDIEKFNKNKLKIEKKIQNDAKYIVCSCNSCFDTLQKIDSIKDKLITIDELLKINNFDIKITEDVVYHQPLQRYNDCYLDCKKINRKGCCSGMENFLMLKHKNIFLKLIENVMYKKEEINNKKLVTSCNLSILGFKELVKKKQMNTQIYSYSEYVFLNLNTNEKK